MIRRRGLYLNKHGLSYIHGTWTPVLGLARVFHARREALAYLDTSELPVTECEIVGVVKVPAQIGWAFQVVDEVENPPTLPAPKRAKAEEASGSHSGRKRPR